MKTNSDEVKTSYLLQVTGGIYPGHHRSTSVEVLSPDLDTCYKAAIHWCKTNFPDWNHISTVPGLKTALFQIPGTIQRDYFHIRISRNYEPESNY